MAKTVKGQRESQGPYPSGRILHHDGFKYHCRDINEIKIPKFPFNGEYVMSRGLDGGKKIGFVLNELEKKWIDNNFNLKDKEAISIVDKVKKLNILNI